MQKIILPGIVFIFLIGCSIRPVISPENQEQYLTSKELDSVNEYYTNEDEYIYSLGLTKNAYGLEKDIYNAVLRNPNITPSDLIDQFEDQYNLLIVILLTESMSVSCEALDVATRLAILFKDDAASGLLSEMYISLEENRIIQTAEVSRIGNYLERIYPGFPSVKTAEGIIGDFQLHSENPEVLERYIAQRVIQIRKDFPEYNFSLYGPESLSTFEFCARQTLSWKKNGRSMYPRSVDLSLNKKDKISALTNNMKTYKELLNGRKAL